MTHDQLDRQISDLDSLLNSVFTLQSAAQRSKDGWDLVKRIGAEFKSIRYPKRLDKDAAWQRFQGLVQQLKALAEEHHKERKQREKYSESLRNQIITEAEAALPGGAMWDLMNMPFRMAENVGRSTLGMNLADHWRDELKQRSSKLTSAFNLHKSLARQMIQSHQQEAWQKLHQVREKLNDDWAAYHKEHGEATQARKQAWQEKQNAWRQKQEVWRDNQTAYINRLRAVLRKQEDYLSKKEDELSRLRDQYSSAYSDGFRDRCSQWIDQCEDKIREVEEGIRDLERKIGDAEDRLRG